MDCVRISLSWEEKKKKKMHPLYDSSIQSEVSKVPIPLLLAGQEGDVEICK